MKTENKKQRAWRVGSAVEAWRKWLDETGQSETTVYNYEVTMRRFMRTHRCVKWPLSRIVRKHAAAFVNTGESIKVATRRFRLRVLNSFFEFCVNERRMRSNPCGNVRVTQRNLPQNLQEPAKRTPITGAEYQIIMANASGFWRAAAALAYWMGLRLCDIAALEWSSAGDDALAVTTRKTASRVELPYDEEVFGGGAVRDVIAALRADSVDDSRYIFPLQRAVIMRPSGHAVLSNQFRRMLAGLGISGKSFHCLRHSFVTRMINSGAGFDEAAKAAGHKSVKTTGAYYHL